MDLRAYLQTTLGSTYRVDKELRGAGMSRVFLALDQQFDRPVVIKVLPPELAASVSIERFKREIHIASQFTHPNIVPVITAGQSGDVLYYVMPLVGEETLRSVMKRERELPLPDVLRYTADVAAALGYAHAQQIVHRDVKPENILLQAGRALLADFGIARAMERAVDSESVTSIGLTVGTPAYMSPEQAAADKNVDGRSDIYSLACVVYEMLAGNPPFQATASRTMIAMHLHERPPSVRIARPDLPEHIDAVLAKALDKSPADRYRSVAEFVDALGSPTAPTSGAQPISHRARKPILAAAITLLAASALAVAWASINHESRAAIDVSDPSRIAVLGFEAPAGDSAVAAAANGFTRDLIAALQQVPSLAVISPEGVAALEHARPDSIGRALRVGTIVSGTIARYGDSLQADVRVIDPATAEQRSSARIRRPLADFLTLRDSIVQESAAQLRRRLGEAIQLRQWRSQTRSEVAWTARAKASQLMAYEWSMPRDPRDVTPQFRVLQRADSLLSAASRADSRWIEPIIARAEIRMRLADYVDGPRTLAQIDSGLALMDSAMSVHRDSPIALATRGQLRYLKVFYGGGGSTAGALRDSARADLIAATSQDPHLSAAWLALSGILRSTGDMAGAVKAGRRALEVDTYLVYAPSVMSRLIYTYLYAGSADSARALCETARKRYPDNPVVGTCELGVLGYSGRGPRDVQRVWQLVAENERSGPWALTAGISPVARYFAAAVLARTGDKDSARAVISETRTRLRSAGAENTDLEAEAYARMVAGDTTTAIMLLRRKIRLGLASREAIAMAPQYAPLRTKPAFRELTTP